MTKQRLAACSFSFGAAGRSGSSGSSGACAGSSCTGRAGAGSVCAGCTRVRRGGAHRGAFRRPVRASLLVPIFHAQAILDMGDARNAFSDVFGASLVASAIHVAC